MHSDDNTQSSGRINSEPEMDEFLAELEAIDAMAPAEAPKPANAFKDRPVLLAKLVATRDELKADAKANGWTAQRNREIDADRKADPVSYNERRRLKYATDKQQKTGKLPRPYRKGVTPEQRKADNAKASQDQRDMLTPGSPEYLAYNAAGAVRAQKSRENRELEAEAERIALESLGRA